MSALHEASPVSLRWIDQAVLGSSTSRVVKRADYEQVMAARSVLAAARDTQASIESQLQAWRQEAERAGHAAGVELGKDAWTQELVRRHLTRQLRLRELQATLVDVVMGAMRHLLHEIPAPDRMEMLAQRVLNDVVSARRIRLVVAASDAPTAWAVLQRWHRDHPHVANIDVVPDDALKPGDCVLETEEGAIDGRLSQRLAAIEAAITASLAAVAAP
jgi:type III secretion protein L